MKRFPKILSIAFAGHVDHGKSSLIEAITGKFPDIYQFEIQKEMTVYLKIISFCYKGVQLNLLDTPGHSDFRFALNLALSIADGVVVVVSGIKGFQAWTEYVLKHAISRKLPIIIAATKSDLPNFNINRIFSDIKERGLPEDIPVVVTSAKLKKGILPLLDTIITNVRPRRRYRAKSKLIIVSREKITGFKVLYLAKIVSGVLRRRDSINTFKIKEIFDIRKKPIDFSYSGSLVYIGFYNLEGEPLEPGTIITDKEISKDPLVYKSINPVLECQIRILNPKDSHRFVQILSELRDKIGLKYEISEDTAKVELIGSLQYQVLEERLKEENILFELIREPIKKRVTVAERIIAKSGTAIVELIPYTGLQYKIYRADGEARDIDIIGVSTACQAVGITGIISIVHKGEHEEDIAKAVGNAIKNAGLINILPNRMLVIRSQNIGKYLHNIINNEIKVVYYVGGKAYFLVPSEKLDDFIDDVLRVTHGKAEVKLIKLVPEERILSIDPGTRHIGFAYIRSDEIPLIWHINLPANLDDKKTQSKMIERIRKEIEVFLKDLEPPNKIFIGSGIGARYAYEAVKQYLEKYNQDVDVFFVDESMTTREAIFRIRSGKIEKVVAESLVDHAVAALIIAKRGIEGKRIKIKNVNETIEEYIRKTYSVGDWFRSISSIHSIKDIKPGMYLKVRDPTMIKTNLDKGEVIIFRKWRKDKSFIASTLTGSKIIVKLKDDVKMERDFFNILQPVKSIKEEE